MAVTSKKKRVSKKATVGTENPASNSVVDEETQEDVLLDEEAMDVDIDEQSPKEKETTPAADTKKPIKPRGKDAESLVLKEAQKSESGKTPASDLKGPLKKLKAPDYLQLIVPLHVELLKMQNWVKAEGKKILVINEGRDAGGKGGTIKRMIEHMNPRGCRVVALDKPSDRERT